jgi:hydrogenase maturation factor
MTGLHLGKIPIDVLNRTVLSMTGARSSMVVTPPSAGLDFAAIRLGGGFLVVSADPITGVTSGIGSYAVNVSANDVATSGNRPQFIESVVLLPERAKTDDLLTIADEIHRTAKALGISVVGGHTEVTPGLYRPIIIVTAFGVVKEYVSSKDAKPGDSLMMTKTAGIEGTAAIAREGIIEGKGVPKSLALRAGRFVTKLSVVEEAVRAYATGCVHAMHDCTEGGVLGATYEMSLASGLGFVMHESAIPVASETREVCSLFSLNPLKLIGSGSVLMSVGKGSEARVKKALEGVCRVTTVGEFTEAGRVLVRRDGSETKIDSAPEDELWRLLAGTPRAGRRLAP